MLRSRDRWIRTERKPPVAASLEKYLTAVERLAGLKNIISFDTSLLAVIQCRLSYSCWTLAKGGS